MESWMPCRDARNAVGTRSLGSAVSDDVSVFMCITTTPRSLATSWMANAPADDSAVEQDLAAVAVDQLARQARGLLGLSLGVTRNQLDHSAVEAAR